MNQPAASETPESLIATIRYFKVGSCECAVCRKPGEVVRMAITITNQILVTVMCEECGGEEIDGLLERKEMVASPDGSALISAQVANHMEKRMRGVSPELITTAQVEAASMPKGTPPKTKKASPLSRFRTYKRRMS